jgi:hypothetical protein
MVALLSIMYGPAPFVVEPRAPRSFKPAGPTTSPAMPPWSRAYGSIGSGVLSFRVTWLAPVAEMSDTFASQAPMEPFSL